uniref:DH domain-containing protein n=2 Tax=Neocellia TaxID=44535 RepID=A0A182SBN9_9DIPT
ISDISSRLSHLSGISDSSEDTSLSPATISNGRSSKASAEIERNDSGVGSETSKTSRSRWQNPASASLLTKITPIHLCEDCDGPVETQVTESGVMYAPLVCRKCGKKRAERKEIITEIVETEEKYGRDLQIILEEFYQPMLVAGLLNQDQLSAIFLNVEELLENNQFLAERMRDALDIANEQGDDDLLTVNIGKIFLEAAPMLHAFESYCVRQGAASLLLANLEKEKELLRIFLRVSQMENAVLRRMNLNSFLMVPVQRVTKYPLLLARLYKVTPAHLEGKELLKQSQEKIELHLNHMNREAKDVPTKLWRRISSSSPGRRLSCELDMINIKLRKMAVDVLEWNHEEVRFAIEGRLLFTQPNDGNWKKSRTIKLTSINALLVTNGKPTASYKADRALSETLSFPRHTGIREASLLLVREKGGRYTLLREPLFLDRCIVCSEHDWEDYFEVQEILSKESFIFKAEDGTKTKQWYAQLQYHSQGMGTWRKRRNALANIMINGMMTRT